MNARLWTVAELVAEVNRLLGQGFKGIQVEGELSNFTRSARGHLYFSLKDDEAQLDCVMWGSTARRLRFDPEDGLAVIASGGLTVYPGRGRFQMVVSALEPQGLGALQLAFEQLKKKLQAEGLFDDERKRELPASPQRIGIVTSATGAALRDMLKVLRRHDHLEVVLAPAAVQGEGAALEIADAIGRIGSSGLVDMVVVGRGGGSLEDLWAFNEEPVARAIVACPVPVVSAVGHEVDFTIADFVADWRAATPTHAAEMVVARLEQKERRLAEISDALEVAMRWRLERAGARLALTEGAAGLAALPQRVRLARVRLAAADRLPELVARLAERTRSRFVQVETALRQFPSRVRAAAHLRRVQGATSQMAVIVRGLTARAHAELASRERALLNLSPTRVLERGYSITRVEGRDTPLTTASEVGPGAHLVTTLAEGELRSLVAGAGAARQRRTGSRTTETKQPTLFDDEDEGDEA
jgi:exodeoxyribonuclease VII large subunit